jgi:hypothetical protein
MFLPLAIAVMEHLQAALPLSLVNMTCLKQAD